jgi:diadenosine tetraphosphate (Ap4A) HIT family hydrolase
MSFHTNYEDLKKYSKKETCFVCNKVPPPKDEVLTKEFTTSVLVAYPKMCLKGTWCLTLKPHTVELYDLNQTDLLNYMKEAKICSKALKEVTKAIKINYELHGNTCPYMHMHLFPRYLDDHFSGQPIDYRQKTSPFYKENEFDKFIKDMREKFNEIN